MTNHLKSSGAQELSPILVLGGSGFIGTNLVKALLALGKPVRIFSRKPPKHFLLTSGAEWFSGDINDPVALERAVNGCGHIYHLVSATDPARSNEDPSLDVHSNLLPTITLLELAVAYGVKRFCYVSSGGTVYGIPRKIPIPEEHPTDPICAYGIGKLSIEKYLAIFNRKYNLDTRVLRLSNPYGTYQPADRPQGAIAVFTARALQGKTIEIWGDGSIVRDYLHISDVTAALLKILYYDGDERTFNLGSGMGYSLNDILAVLKKNINRSIDVRYTESRNFDVPINVLDVQRIRESLGWEPEIGLEKGVMQTIEEFREYIG